MMTWGLPYRSSKGPVSHQQGAALMRSCRVVAQSSCHAIFMLPSRSPNTLAAREPLHLTSRSSVTIYRSVAESPQMPHLLVADPRLHHSQARFDMPHHDEVPSILLDLLTGVTATHSSRDKDTNDWLRGMPSSNPTSENVACRHGQSHCASTTLVVSGENTKSSSEITQVTITESAQSR